MPRPDKLPKDTLYLLANDMDDFKATKQRWETWGWVLGADYQNGMYEVVGMKDSKIIVLLYQEPQQEEKKEIEDLAAESAGQDSSTL